DLTRRGSRGTGPLRLGAEHVRRTGGGFAVPGCQQRDDEADHGHADDDQRGRHLPPALGPGLGLGCPVPWRARRWVRVRWLRVRWLRVRWLHRGPLEPDQTGGPGRGHWSLAIALNRAGSM